MHQPRIMPPLLFCLIVSVATLRGQTKPPTPPVTATPTTAAAKSPVTTVISAYPKTPAEFFARARQWSDLEAADISFHLKATFVASGEAEFTGNGTYEEWWQNADNWRMETTFGDFRLVSMNTPNGPYLYASSDNIPEIVSDAMAKVFIRVAPDAGTSGHWKIKPKTVHGMKLIRVSMNAHVEPNGASVAGRNEYFSSNGILRIQQSFKTTTIYNGFQQFQTLLVPRTIQTQSGRSDLLKISINTLEPLRADSGVAAKLNASPVNLPLVANAILGGTGPMVGHIVKQVQPRYPAIAREIRIQGTVVFATVIDENGKIRDLRAVKSPNNILTQAARDAVRQWRYQPTIVDGKAVPVYTMISVVFMMNN